MKKPLLALAGLGLAGCALAQSSVTLFGVMDVALSRYQGEGTGSAVLMSSGNLATGRLGFRGVEDLGDGLAASFWLEAAVNNDDGRGVATNAGNQAVPAAAAAGQGGLTFNRRSTVSLSGPFGELRLGRDYTPSFWNLSVFDPFGVLGSASVGNLAVANTTLSAVRASNSVGYFTPGCSAAAGCPGFYGQAMVALGENASGAPTSANGNYWGLRAGYNAGPVQAAAATSRSKDAAAGDFSQTNLGAAYDAGFARFMLQAGTNKAGVRGAVLAGTAKASFAMLGAVVRLGVDELRVSYTHLKLDNSNASTAGQLGLGYVHPLSRRTALYAMYSRISNQNGLAGTPRFAVTGGPAVAAVNGTATGLDLGIRHTF